MAISNALNLTTTGLVAADGAGTYTGRTITAGTGVTVSNGNGVSGNPTVNAVGAGLTWTVVSVNGTFTVNTGTIANKAGTLTMALPASSALGDVIAITGINTALGWQITQAAGQQIFIGTSSTTAGATGTLTSSATRDSLMMVCVVANLTWNVFNVVGNITTG